MHYTFHISKLTQLTSVSLIERGRLGPTDLFVLQALPDLRHLRLQNIMVPATAMLQELTQLQHLSVHNCCFRDLLHMPLPNSQARASLARLDVSSGPGHEQPHWPEYLVSPDETGTMAAIDYMPNLLLRVRVCRSNPCLCQLSPPALSDYHRQ